MTGPAFQAALSEGFCPDCLIPLQPRGNTGYCRGCRGYWQTAKEGL